MEDQNGIIYSITIEVVREYLHQYLLASKIREEKTLRETVWKSQVLPPSYSSPQSLQVQTDTALGFAL